MIFSISIVFLLIALMMQFVLVKQQEKDILKAFMNDRLVCEQFADEIHSVFVLGNGTKSTIKISQDLNVSQGTVISGSVLCHACCNITKNGSSTFSVNPGFLTLQNSNGGIIV